MPIRMCSVCHSGRHGRDHMKGVALFLVITWLFISGTQPSFRLDVRWGSGGTFLSMESVSCFPFGGKIRGFCSLKDRKKVSSDESVSRGLTVFDLDFQPVK